MAFNLKFKENKKCYHKKLKLVVAIKIGTGLHVNNYVIN